MRTVEVQDNDDHYLIKAEGQGEPTQCPSCGGETASMGRMTGGDLYGSQTTERQIEYGPHIPTLCDLLEQGYFED